MEPRRQSTPPRGIWLALVILGGGIGLAVLVALSMEKREPPPPTQSLVPDGGPLDEDPRRTFDTPFQNVRPEVRYVGDAVCLKCHQKECDQYRAHPMGRSMSKVGVGPKTPADVEGSFSVEELQYEARFRDGRMNHKESAKKPDGAALAERSAAINHTIGSGGRGYSYLFDDNGYLFQSPISFYSSRKSLDLSPGYRERNAHFDRPVDANCLFCHANGANPVEHTINRYREPIFSGHAIGCERCHGPGELHAERGGAPGRIDYTIVNPKHLEPALREAVCQQCHLQGQARVLRAGRAPFDFRPGLPLELFYDTFVWHPGVPHEQKAVGHVEQMVESACFTKSNGKLGCVSCHDPHEKPKPEASANHYRQRCLSCHTEAQCGIPAASRREKNGDACASCHMPARSASDIVHVSVSDHRILREPGKERAREVQPPRAGEPPLVAFHANSRYTPPRDAARDLGLALIQLAGQTPPGPQREYLARLSLPRLRDAPRVAHDHATGLALAAALRLTGQRAEALAATEAVLKRVPGHESALVEAATIAVELKRPVDAAGYWRRAIEVSPRRWNYHYQLASVLVDQRDWAGAVAASAEARRLNPLSTDARLLEVASLLELKRRDEAAKAFEEVMILKPPRADELKKWFEKERDR